MVDIKVTTTGYTVDGQTEVTAKVPLAAAIRKAEEFPEGAVITVVSNLILVGLLEMKTRMNVLIGKLNLFPMLQFEAHIGDFVQLQM